MSTCVDPSIQPHGLSCVVVADDDDEIRCLLAASLRRTGRVVLEARDGLELLTVLSAVSTQEMRPPSAVISDVKMPLYDGIDVLRSARTYGIDVPFILVTAHCDERVLAGAEELGATAIFDKPFDLDLLIRTVREVEETA